MTDANPWAEVASTMETPTKQKSPRLIISTKTPPSTPPSSPERKKRRVELRDEDFWSSEEEEETENDEEWDDRSDTSDDGEETSDALKSINFFQYMSNSLDITSQELEMMKGAFEAGEKQFANSEADDLRVNEAFRAFLMNEEDTVGASQTYASVDFRELDVHVRKGAVDAPRPVDLMTGSCISGFYGPLTGSYRSFGPSIRLSSKEKEDDEENLGEFTRYLLERTFMVRKPKAKQDIWVECFVVALCNTGIKSFVEVLPLSASLARRSRKLKNKKSPKRPKSYRESQCFWTVFNENRIVEKNDKLNKFVQVQKDVNAFVKKENVRDLELARANRKMVVQRAKKAALSRKRRRELEIVKNMMKLKNPGGDWDNLQQPVRARSRSISSITGGLSPRSPRRSISTITGRPSPRKKMLTQNSSPVVEADKTSSSDPVVVTELKALLVPSAKLSTSVPTDGAIGKHDVNIDDTPSPGTILDVPWLELHAK